MRHIQCIVLLVHNYYKLQRVLVSMVILMFSEPMERRSWVGGSEVGGLSAEEAVGAGVVG